MLCNAIQYNDDRIREEKEKQRQGIFVCISVFVFKTINTCVAFNILSCLVFYPQSASVNPFRLMMPVCDIELFLLIVPCPRIDNSL